MSAPTVPLPVLLLVTLIMSGSNLFATVQSTAEKAESIRLKLREIDQSLSAPEYVGRNIESDLAAIPSLSSYREFLKQVSAEFSNQIQSREQPFANLGYTIEHLTQHLDQFEVSTREFGSLAMIQADLDQIRKMAKQAVEYQAPAYFNSEGDIHRRTESAKLRIRYLEALTPQSGDLKLAREHFVSASKEVAEIQKSLSAKILEQNELPPDGYRRADREALLKLIQDKWRQSGNRSQILKVGIVATDWKRSESWEVQNRTLYKLDRSRLQGYVIVPLDAQRAVRHSINLVKDHVDGDKISLSFLGDPKADPELFDQILRSKIK